MKKLLFCIAVLMCSLIVNVSAAETKITIDSFTNVEEWSGSSSKSQLSINELEEYVKEGNTSLMITYPVSLNGKNYNFYHKNYKNGGLAIPAAEEGKIIDKVGIWVYVPEADDNLQLFLQTKNPATTSFIKSEEQLLDFTGWKYLTFDINSTDNYIRAICIEKVANKPYETEKYIYMDSLDIIYAYDPAYAVDLDVTTSITDGEERVTPDIGEIVCDFTTPVADGEQLFSVEFSPAVECEIQKVTDQQYKIVLKNNLEANQNYTMSIRGVNDIYEQTLDKIITFSTAYFDLMIDRIEQDSVTITNIDNIEPGNVKVTVSTENYNENLNGKTVWLFCSMLSSENKLFGIKVRPITLESSKITEMLDFDVIGVPEKINIFVLDSLTDRNIVQSITKAGELND